MSSLHQIMSKLTNVPFKQCIIQGIASTQYTPHKMLSTTVPRLIKEISINTEGERTVIEGRIMHPAENSKVLDIGDKKFCPLCPNKLQMDIKYTDVLILSQFMRYDGCVLPRRATGLCGKAQARLNKLIHQAQRSGLLPELRPALPNGRQRTSPNSTYKWKKYNAYHQN